MNPVEPRGLPPRIYVPIVVAVAAIFLTIVGLFLRSGLGVTGSAIGPEAQSSASAPVASLPSAEPGEVVVPQSGGAAAPGESVGGGGPANVAGGPGGGTSGGPPVVVQRLLTEYRNRLQRDPKDLAALVSLAQLEFDAGMFDRAIPYYERALSIDAQNPDTRTDYATALHDTGKDLQSLAELRIVLARDPNFGAALFNEGIVANAIGRRTEAIGAFQHFLAVSPHDGRADDARAALKNLGA